MIKDALDMINISIVFSFGWIVFGYVSKNKLNYIKDFKEISLIFFIGTSVLFFLYLSYLEQFFIKFTLIPFFTLFLFYVFALLIYQYMKNHTNKQLIKQSEIKRIYSASMSYRYLLSKSFNILFQQMGVLCTVAFLKDLRLSAFIIMLFFGFTFAITHIYFHITKRASMIAKIFVPASFIGGLVFSFILITIQYGIIYSFIIHWLFYIFLGVFINYQKKFVWL